MTFDLFIIFREFYQLFLFALSTKLLITVFNSFPLSLSHPRSLLFIPALPLPTQCVLYNRRCKQITLCSTTHRNDVLSRQT